MVPASDRTLVRGRTRWKISLTLFSSAILLTTHYEPRTRGTMSSNTMRLLAAACSEIAGVGAVALLFYYLSITDVTRVGNIWAVDRVVAYLLLFAGPLLIFLPASLALRLGPLPLLGAAHASPHTAFPASGAPIGSAPHTSDCQDRSVADVTTVRPHLWLG